MGISQCTLRTEYTDARSSPWGGSDHTMHDDIMLKSYDDTNSLIPIYY